MWFLLEVFLRQIEKALTEGLEFSAAEKMALEKASADFGKITMSGRQAIIPVEGILTEKRNYFAAYFGGGNTLYPDISRSIAEANGDPSVDKIYLDVGYSPGGGVIGMFESMDNIRGSVKPVIARVKHGALSAAYGLVSQAGKVQAAGRATQFGSVGVAYDTMVFAEDVSIASTEAPDKRPDLTTEEGKQVIRKQLDAVHALFADSIAAGRNTDTKTVNEKFGRGALVLAGDAKAAGMIDKIAKPQQTAAGGNKPEAKQMNRDELKAKFPELYAALEAEFKAVGVVEERERATAHLILGEASGDMKTAVAAVQDGSPITEIIRAKHMAASMNRQSVVTREEENPDTSHLPAAPPDASSLESQTARAYDEMFGADESEGGV